MPELRAEKTQARAKEGHLHDINGTCESARYVCNALFRLRIVINVVILSPPLTRLLGDKR